MRIINNSGNPLQYLVTASGTTLSGSPIIASGYVSQNSATQFNLDGAGTHPIVYVRSVAQGSKGYTGRQVSNGNATVNIIMTEE